MIRAARVNDLPGFLDLAQRAVAAMPTYPDCPYDRESCVTVFGKCLNSALGLALVAVRHGKITGALLGYAQELAWSRAREATDVMLYAEHPGDGYRMARRFIDWAWSVPRVTVVTLAHSFGGTPEQIERVARLHEQLGARRIGVITQIVRPAYAGKEEAA